jgi:hypothetical protein
MTKRYEITHARGEASLVLIFPQGGWETVPFEIRLLRPWHGSEFCDRSSLSATQRLEIATRGYCVVAQAADALGTGAANSGSLPRAAAVSRDIAECREDGNGLDAAVAFEIVTLTPQGTAH